jgi:hypothetical protein
MPVTSAFTLPIIFAPINWATQKRETGFSKRIKEVLRKGNYQAIAAPKGCDTPIFGYELSEVFFSQKKISGDFKRKSSPSGKNFFSAGIHIPET